MPATQKETLSERAGRTAGWLVSPLVALATRARGVRLLHAEGQTYTADALPQARGPKLEPLAARLGGAALVRLSAAVWRGREWPDVLGLSLRFFGRPKARPDAAGIQDLLFATAPSLLALPLGFVTTDPHDFLANRYNALAAFELEGIGRVQMRATWPSHSPSGTGRFNRLMSAVVQERARFVVELRESGAREWQPLVHVRLRVPAALDDARLRFSPFNDRGGLHPAGFVQALRVGPYTAGQKARGADEPRRAGATRFTPRG